MTEHEELLMLRALAAKQALYDAYVESERSLDEIIELILQCLSVIMKFHAEIPEKGQKKLEIKYDKKGSYKTH